MNRNYAIFFYLLLVLTFCVTGAISQTCNGALGDPVKKYDFGRGPADRGPAIPDLTNYQYTATGVPSDGGYTIVKTTAGMSHVLQGSWHLVINHTPDDPDGYMMLINADDKQAGLFYQDRISGLCPGTTYDFGAWIINLMAKPGIKPDLKFTIETISGNLIKEFNTGDIPEGNSTDWKRYGTTFITGPGVDEVVVKIKNNGLGGAGNDFALDDITFSACGPVIIPSIDGALTQNQNSCAGDTKNFVLTADVSPGVYTSPQYLWQEMVNGTWQDMPAERTTQYTKSFVNAQSGSYKYRLLVAELGNINSPNCRTNSPEFELKVFPIPVPVVKPNLIVCIGDPIDLSVSQASAYKWTGPNGFSTNERSPIINNAVSSMAGSYEVTVTNEGGCEQTAQINVTIVPRVQAAVDPVQPICQGTAVQLNASGGTSYKWSPAADLSDPNIANPIASPKLNTTYTVTVSNGGCEATAAVTVIVNENATAFAGQDKKILEGQQVTLDGLVGDKVDFFWSPTEGLDNPYKLNPVASPTRDITYTLNAISKLGCGSASDQVLVRVYQTVIVPNSFSPNGDGINDFWNLTAIDTYSNPTVKIMNRYGQLLFESSGYEKPWNGKYKNQDLPSGVYYYIIHLNPELKPLTGSLMLIR